MKKQFLSGLAKYGLGIGVLVWVIWTNWAPGGPGTGLSGILKPPRLGPLVAAFAIYLVAILITFLRWYVLVRAQDLPFTVVNSMRLGLIGFFFSTCFPGSIGGDVVKAYCIAKEQSRRTVAVATVVIDRLIGLWALFWLVAIAGAIFWLAGDPALEEHQALETIIRSVFALVGVSTLACVVLMTLPVSTSKRLGDWLEAIPKVGHSLGQLWNAVQMYRTRWPAVLLALAMSLVGHVGFVLTFYFSAQVFLTPGQEDLIPSLTENFLVVPIGMTIQAGFPAPGGVGGGEAGFGWVYTLAGGSYELGVAGSLTQRLITWVLSVVGYFVYLQMKPQIQTAQHEAESDAEINIEGSAARPEAIMEKLPPPPPRLDAVQLRVP